MKEEWKLAKDFSELRPNLLFKIIKCNQCGRTHIGILGEFISDPKEKYYIEMWPACDGIPGGIGEKAVKEGRVFILINEDDLKQAEVNKLKKLTPKKEPARLDP